MSKHYPVEQRERAVKMVLDHLDEYRSVYAACQAIGTKVGVGWSRYGGGRYRPRSTRVRARVSRLPSSRGSRSWSGRTGISRGPTIF
jgi:hypothetical protein